MKRSIRKPLTCPSKGKWGGGGAENRINKYQMYQEELAGPESCGPDVGDGRHLENPKTKGFG